MENIVGVTHRPGYVSNQEGAGVMLDISMQSSSTEYASSSDRIGDKFGGVDSFSIKKYSPSCIPK